MNLLDFQQKAVDQLIETFKDFWWQDRGKKIIFQSPTGSGKTFMVSSFINQTNMQPDWNRDKAFIWITFSDDLAKQSRKKCDEYFPNSDIKTLSSNDFHEEKLQANDTLFINWQKLVSKRKEDRLLRRPENEDEAKENGYYFEDIIEKTHQEEREIVLIIDESHTHSKTTLAESVIEIINPKLIINVSATPNENLSADAVSSGKMGYVRVDRKNVVEEGLIKKSVLLQTEEEITSSKSQTKDLDEVLLDLAIKRRESLKSEYEQLNKSINPLILIQLPNKSQEVRGVETSKKDMVLNYLIKRKQIKESKIALWFDREKKNLKGIEENNNHIDFLLFKQAAGTGWDCPRAHIIVMFRDIKNQIPYVQTLGRILRMPEPHLIQDYENNPRKSPSKVLRSTKKWLVSPRASRN